jgi:hypothetical protein
MRTKAVLKPESLSEQLLFSTVRIETQDVQGIKGYGTGFFFAITPTGADNILAIITNKHVIEGAVTGELRFHESTNEYTESSLIEVPSDNSFNVSLDRFEERWIHHPNSDVDLCAMLFDRQITSSDIEGRIPYIVSLEDNLIASDLELEQLSAVEEILMIGYPIGLWDNVNNLPIIRRGITATHPAIDFCGRSITVIDAACFPGSSGSPVLITNEVITTAKTGEAYLRSRLILLGVLSSGPVFNAVGEIVIRDIPTVKQPVSVTEQMIHLGYVVKAKEIISLSEHIKTVALSQNYTHS